MTDIYIFSEGFGEVSEYFQKGKLYKFEPEGFAEKLFGIFVTGTVYANDGYYQRAYVRVGPSTETTGWRFACSEIEYYIQRFGQIPPKAVIDALTTCQTL